MSQTETILLIVLGFSLASLIALFMGRMIWTAALRVGARRMQRQVPSSLVGLQTERDRLRAEYAMLAQRLGARLEEAKIRLAEQTAEVSRHRNRIHAIETGEAGRTEEIRRLSARVKSLEAELAGSKAAEGELRHLLASKEEALRKLRKKKGYEGHKQAQEKAEPTPPPSEDPEVRLRQRIDKLTQLARKPAPDDGIAERLAEAEKQTRDLEAELQNLESTWSPPGPSAAGNVIPLPNRAKDLKTGTTPSS